MVRKLFTRIPGKKKKIEAECTTSEVEKLERVKKDMEDQIINQCKDFGFCTYSDGKPTEEIEQRSQTHPMTTAIVL